MTKNELVAAEVETWNRTPFHPQQAVRGRGVDCKMLPAGIARDLGFPEAQSFYALTTGYSLNKRNGLPHRLLLEGLSALFDQVPVTQEGDGRGLRLIGAVPGDILLLKVQALSYRPSHLAIVSRRDGHAWHAQIEPNDFVKEASLRSLLKKCPLHSVWRWRDG